MVKYMGKGNGAESDAIGDIARGINVDEIASAILSHEARGSRPQMVQKPKTEREKLIEELVFEGMESVLPEPEVTQDRSLDYDATSAYTIKRQRDILGQTKIDVTDANQNLLRAEIGPDGQSVLRASIEDRFGKVNHRIENGYLSIDTNNGIHKHKILSSEIDEQGNLKVSTVAGVYEFNSDGSRVERDPFGQLRCVKDANGNTFRYSWDQDGSRFPSKVEIAGPAVGNHRIELERTGRFVAPDVNGEQFDNGAPEYSVRMDGQAKPSTASISIGGGADLPGGGIGGGISYPIQEKVGFSVGQNGDCEMTASPQTIDEQGQGTVLTFHTNGTSELRTLDPVYLNDPGRDGLVLYTKERSGSRKIYSRAGQTQDEANSPVQNADVPIGKR